MPADFFSQIFAGVFECLWGFRIFADVLGVCPSKPRALACSV